MIRISLVINNMDVTVSNKYTGQKELTADTVQVEPNVTAVRFDSQRFAEARRAFKAENKITLKPGFHAKSGSVFSTKLETVAYADLDKLIETNAYDSTRGFLLSKADTNYKVGLTGTTNPEVFYQKLGYYKNGNVDTIDIRNNQTKGNWPELLFVYSYDDYNRLTGGSCSLPQFNSSYTYDNDGNLLTKNTGNDNISYAHYKFLPDFDGNKSDRLETVSSTAKGTVSFDYDGKVYPPKLHFNVGGAE